MALEVHAWTGTAKTVLLGAMRSADVVNRYVASQALAQLCAVVDFEYVKEVASDFEVGVWVWCNA